jgi:hypothetical protein
MSNTAQIENAYVWTLSPFDQLKDGISENILAWLQASKKSKIITAHLSSLSITPG